MKLSKRTEYGIRALVEMARREDTHPAWVQISQIAHTTHIPEKFLEQILLTLRNQGILRSRRGVDGGYALNCRPREVTLAQMIKALEGANAQEADTGRGDETLQVVHAVMKKADAAADAVLKGKTLAELAVEANDLASNRSAGTEYQI